MKKLFASLLGIAVLCFAVKSMAFDIPTGGSSEAAKVKQVTKEVVKEVTTAAINDKLKKENCAFVAGKQDATTCDLGKILGYLTEWKKGLETSGVTQDFDIHVEASAPENYDLASKRVGFVESKLKTRVSYWDWYSNASTTNGDKIKIWITQ